MRCNQSMHLHNILMQWIDKPINGVIWLMKRANSFDNQSGAHCCFKYYWELSLLQNWVIIKVQLLLGHRLSRVFIAPKRVQITEILKFLNYRQYTPESVMKNITFQWYVCIMCSSFGGVKWAKLLLNGPNNHIQGILWFYKEVITTKNPGWLMNV